MGQKQLSGFKGRQRLLLIAHVFDSKRSMESRLGWFRSENAANRYDVTVLCAKSHSDLRNENDAKLTGVDVVTVPHSAFEKLLMKFHLGFYLAYRLWHLRVFRVAKQLHERQPFSIAHQVSYCGYREPGYCWKLDVPFVWGPIGGTQNVPWRFLSQLGGWDALKECCRSVANGIQLRFGRRVGLALRAASKVFAANQEVQASIRQARGVELSCQLETGLEAISDVPRDLRDTQKPLRVLWAGRLESWKALPLLLKAVARLPEDVELELRILGSGRKKRRYMQLAKRLGIESRLQWVPLPDCGTRQQHYQWADVFAFTSLRDTSGTGLLESLAAGAPIIGLDHQGARDIMTNDCALPIPVENPQQVISDFGNALELLAGNPKLLQNLSDGALIRAQKYLWEQLAAEMNEAYTDSLQSAPEVGPLQESNQEDSRQQAVTLAG